MMERLIDIDQQLLLAINGWHAAWADNIMWLISGKLTWIPLYLLLAGLLFWRFGWKKALWMLLAIGITVGLADYVRHYQAPSLSSSSYTRTDVRRSGAYS